MTSLFFMLAIVWLLTVLVEIYRDYLKELSRYDLATNPYAASIRKVSRWTVVVVNIVFAAFWAFAYFLVYQIGKWLGFPFWWGGIVILAIMLQGIRLLWAITQTRSYLQGQGQSISEEERAQRRKARAQEITRQISAGTQDAER